MVGDFVNVNRFLDASHAEGPGLRACLWVQGCLRRCPGCYNVDQLPIEERWLAPVDELCSRIATAQEELGIEGITFLGGEPLLQASGLARIAKFCRCRGLTVMTFTGYTLEECRRSHLPGVPELLAATDVLVDGAFVAEQLDHERNWVESTNQRLHYFTDAYNASIETDPRCRHVVELREEDGRVYLNGCPHVVDACLMRDIPPGGKIAR